MKTIRAQSAPHPGPDRVKVELFKSESWLVLVSLCKLACVSLIVHKVCSFKCK